jgi:hypothetical protein
MPNASEPSGRSASVAKLALGAIGPVQRDLESTSERRSALRMLVIVGRFVRASLVALIARREQPAFVEAHNNRNHGHDQSCGHGPEHGKRNSNCDVTSDRSRDRSAGDRSSAEEAE